MKQRRRVTFDESLKECFHSEPGPAQVSPLQEGVLMFFVAVWYWIVGVPVTEND
jgi:hypothetical protein